MRGQMLYTVVTVQSEMATMIEQIFDGGKTRWRKEFKCGVAKEDIIPLTQLMSCVLAH